ncbi:MAG: acyl-CoA dehydrogenase family protein [Dissulfuribacterales bacterium]
MDFIITKEQKSMQKAAREFLKSECTSEFVREMEKSEKGYTSELWRKMGELDWMALSIPEEYGGVGGALIDLILMMEEMGRVCAPGPFFSTIVLGGFSLSKYGTEEQKKRILPKIANAETIMTLALTEPEMSKYDPYLISVGAVSEGDDFVIDGIKLFVPDAHVADIIICAARTSGRSYDREGITIFMVDAKSPGIELSPLKTIGGDKQFEVIFNKVKVSKSNILGSLDQGGAVLKDILKYAAICKCAEMVGGAQKVLEMASAYAKERRQFGKQIGSFQAIQHHCANMLIDLEGSRYITYKAAWMLGNKLPCDREISIAKAWVSDSYKKIVALGHQVQGGSAFMEEHDMPLYSRRAAAAMVAFGDAGYHREKVACFMGL